MVQATDAPASRLQHCKGFYDANIWASLHDVVRPERRATAVGFMNSIGWLGGGIAPVAIAAASARYGMSACISATSALYFVVGLLLAWGIWKHMGGKQRVQLGRNH